MANSSPPKRAAVSALRSWARSRSATTTSSLSPTWWPRLLFRFLKLSMSSHRTLVGTLRLALGLADGLGETVQEESPIGQAGEVVVEALVT